MQREKGEKFDLVQIWPKFLMYYGVLLYALSNWKLQKDFKSGALYSLFFPETSHLSCTCATSILSASFQS